MASQNDLLTRLITLVRGLDDASWEALTSKGMLRRARKDLEAGLAVSVSAVTDSGVTLLVPPFEVSMPTAGPARATCSSIGQYCSNAQLLVLIERIPSVMRLLLKLMGI